ncbi:hypothetical protein RHSIM_Rhsim09G0062400 [Rhododendron simsii]|uniref:Uncharacterized protein n=1 Tax=Rhododendron simsii TaxID=118357 RepID=A0A834LE46_RHOSS|nr:hypothetical protein RHSIM_Rhsim09G0062400 [Rhododendron simsii]
MVRDDMESGSKAIMHASIRVLPVDQWCQAPYLGSSGDSFWRKAEAFVAETEISAEPLSLVPEVPPEEADLIPHCFVLQFRVERGDIPSYFINYEATTQAPVYWHDWIEVDLANPDSVQILEASCALELVRLSMDLSIRKNNTNIDLMVSRWRFAPSGDSASNRASERVQREDAWFRSPSCRFFSRPYAEPVDGALLTNFFSEDERIMDFQMEGAMVSASALSAFVTACPFLAVSDIYHRDISLRSSKARQFGWHGKSSYWPSSTAIPVTTRGITIAEPISTVLPLRVTCTPIRVARTPRSKEAPLSVVSADPLLKYEGGKHAPLSKLKTKRMDVGPRVHEEGSDSSIDDTIPISQFFKLPCVAQRSPSGKSVAIDKKVIDLDESGSEGTGSDIENIVQLVVEEDEEDDDISSLIPRRRVSTERFLTVPYINLLALEAAIQHSLSMELANLNSVEVFADIQNDSLISLGTLQMGYVVSEFGEESSLLA